SVAARRPGRAIVRPRQRGGNGPHPRLLSGSLGVRAPHVPDPVEPGRRGRRELLARLLAAGPRPQPGDDTPPPEAGPEEEPQAPPGPRAVPRSPGQAVLRAGLPGADAEVRPARPCRGAVRHVRATYARHKDLGRRA